MNYKLKLTSKAKEDFLFLQRNIQERIVAKLRFFLAQNQPLKYAKKLKNSQLGSYRFRVGDYRIIFDLDKDGGNIIIVLILRIRHRKEVYL